MAKKRKGKKRHPSHRRKKPAHIARKHNGCTALILVDSAPLRKLIGRARKEAAWGFTQWPAGKAGRVLANYRTQLEHEEFFLEDKLDEMEDFLEVLEKEEEEFNRQSQSLNRACRKDADKPRRRAASASRKTNRTKQDDRCNRKQMEFDLM